MLIPSRVGRLPCVAATLLFLAAPISAAVFTPDSTDDLPDIDVGDGICRAQAVPPNPVGKCTLRAAIMEANSHSNADTIQLNGGTYTITRSGADEDAGSTGDLDITHDLIIQSAAGVLTEINGGQLDRVFDVHGTANVTFSGLIISGGDATTSSTMQQGGAMRLQSSGNSLVQFCRLEYNSANTGGAIWAVGDVALVRFSSIHHNKAVSTGITNPEGSGIRAQQTTVRVENSSIYANSMIGVGVGSRASISLQLADLLVFSSTISGDNQSGIWTYNSNVTLQNATLYGNAASGILWSSHSSYNNNLFIRNSIIDSNGSDCTIIQQAGDVIDIDGHNLDSDSSCGLSTSNGNLPNTDPRLSPLDQSSLLPVHWPAFDSPVINAGSPLDPASGNPDACFLLDQLGIVRSTGKCDMGAVEEPTIFRNGFEA